MKTLTLIFALTFTVMFSSTSYAEWTKVGANVHGDTFYVDFERIRKHGGYVYYWRLVDYLKPDKWGDLSAQMYVQGDCKLLRSKTLAWSTYTRPMGRGDHSTFINKPNKNWTYPHPNSVGEKILNRVCASVK